jgi:mono/diheme cytochrome c family protein
MSVLRKWISLAMTVGGAALVGCGGNARVSNEISAQVLRQQPRLAEGQRAFMQNCNQCHPGGSGGVGPVLNDKKIPPFFVRLKVRHPMGTMPRFTEEVLPDAKLDDIVTYLRFLRQHGGEIG